MAHSLHWIEVGTEVKDNDGYEVVVAGEYNKLDFVPCRRKIDTNGPICVFLAASVLGITTEEEEQ